MGSSNLNLFAEAYSFGHELDGAWFYQKSSELIQSAENTLPSRDDPIFSLTKAYLRVSGILCNYFRATTMRSNPFHSALFMQLLLNVS